MSHDPAAKMAVHDALPKPLRDLTNEYGVNAVARFSEDASTAEDLKEMLGMWRANRQADLLRVRRRRA